MAFRDWVEVEAADPLILPIRGKQYSIPALGHLDEIKLIAATDKEAEPDERPTVSDEEFLRMVLGDVLDELRGDNVPVRAILHAAMVAHTDARHGRFVAEQLWEKGPDPEALAASMQAAIDDMTTSLVTAADASSTKPRASTSGTRSPRKKPTKSVGAKSSPTRGS